MGAERAPVDFPCPCCPSIPGLGSWPSGTFWGLGRGTLLNARSVYVDWNLRSQLTPRMEVWGVRLCTPSVHPRNISECSCWQAPEVNESNLLISTGKAGPEGARDSARPLGSPVRIRSTHWSSRVDTSHRHITHSSQMWVRPALETGGGVRLAVMRTQEPGRHGQGTLYGEVAP